MHRPVMWNFWDVIKNSNKPFHKHWLLQGLTLGFYVLSHYCHHLEGTFRTAIRISAHFISQKSLELGVLSCSVPFVRKTEEEEDQDLNSELSPTLMPCALYLYAPLSSLCIYSSYELQSIAASLLSDSVHHLGSKWRPRALLPFLLE